jgi:hypothetical protein
VESWAPNEAPNIVTTEEPDFAKLVNVKAEIVGEFRDKRFDDKSP